MRYGINLPVSTAAATPAVVAAAARRAEELGYASLWVGDHVAMPVDYSSRYPYASDGRMTWDLQTPWLDPLMTLLWAAAHTHSIALGTAVLIPAMRPPVLLAKQLATLDHLSGGRLLCGMGMGWLAEEFHLLGQASDRRAARLVEWIEALRASWRPGIAEYHGEFIDLPRFACAPKPPQGERLPILIGGSSDLVLRRVASHADGWLPIEMPPERFVERAAFLDTELAAAGRCRGDLGIVMQGDAATFTPQLGERFAALGVQQVILEISWRNQNVDGAMDQMRALAAKFGLRHGGSEAPAPP